MADANKELHELRQKIIDEQHNGDEAKFMAEINDGYSEMIGWDQIMDSVNILPDLEHRTQILVTQILGFLPEPYLLIPQEPFLRAILLSRDTGMINNQQLYEKTEQCLIPIRNKWLETPHSYTDYPENLYRQYEQLVPEYKQKVRSRLTSLLGYEPDLATSICVEINLSNTMFKDIRVWPEHMTPADLQAIMIIKYREVLLTQGKNTADQSLLPAEQIEMYQKTLK